MNEPNRSADTAAKGADSDALIKQWRASGSGVERIAAELAAKIASGQMRRWDELPPRVDLASEYRVSERTVTRANGLLADHGFLAKTGRRYYVA